MTVTVTQAATLTTISIYSLAIAVQVTNLQLSSLASSLLPSLPTFFYCSFDNLSSSKISYPVTVTVTMTMTVTVTVAEER